MKFILILIALCLATGAYADTLSVQVNRDNGAGTEITDSIVLNPANIGAATAAQGAKADKARNSATVTILPYGDTRQADYYCTATDCGVTFTAAFTAIKAAYTGAKIQVLDGVYPFTTTADGTDLDSVLIEGVNPVGMWSHYGTIFSQNADVKMFSFVHGTMDPRGVEFSRIHFKSDAAKTKPVLYYQNAHNMGQSNCYFETTPQAIYAERAWDFWTQNNNFRDCGTGNTSATACITSYDGATDRTSGWKFMGNRWETRPGTSFYSDSTGGGGANNNIMFVGNNKFEGTTGHGFPAIYGEMNQTLIEGNGFYHGDAGYPSIVLTGWGGNVVAGNFFQDQYSYAVESNGQNLIIGNTFQNTSGTPTAHIHTLGSGNRVVNNIRAFNTLTILQDDGTSTKAYHNDGSENNALANLSDWPSAVSAIEVSYLDGVTSAIQAQLDGKAASSALSAKQDALVSGTNIKTVNGSSLLGTGNLAISSGSSLTVQEADGAPTGQPTTLKLPNGSITDNGGGVFTVAFPNSGGGTVTGVQATAPLASDGNTVTPTLSMPAATDSASGYMTATDHTALTGKVMAPSTNTANYVPRWSGANSKTLSDGLAVGTGANNLVQLDGNSKLPAVDGSALTMVGVRSTDSITAIGRYALGATTGVNNTAFGRSALPNVTSGTDNVGMGRSSGAAITTGSANLAIGTYALFVNQTGNYSVGIGGSALNNWAPADTTGNHVAIGVNAGSAITTGSADTFIGSNAGYTGTTATVSKAIAIGYNAQVTASNTAVIGGSGSDGVTIKNGDGTFTVTPAGDVAAKTFTPTIPAATTYASTTTIDLSLGDSPSVTLTGNPTLAFSNPKAGQWHRLNLIQGATGGPYTVTWPATGLVCTWRNTAGHAAPTLLTAAGAVDTFIIHTLSTTSAECWAAGNQ